MVSLEFVITPAKAEQFKYVRWVSIARPAAITFAVKLTLAAVTSDLKFSLSDLYGRILALII